LQSWKGYNYIGSNTETTLAIANLRAITVWEAIQKRIYMKRLSKYWFRATTFAIALLRERNE
jgi:hypothetical protein